MLLLYCRACLALFHLFGAAFLSSTDVLDAHLLLQAMPGLAFDADRLMLVARGAYKEVSPEALQVRYNMLVQYVM